MNQEAQTLLTALASVLRGEFPDVRNLAKTVPLAKKHSVLNMLAEPLLKSDLTPLQRQKLMTYYAEYVSQQESLAAGAEELFAALEKQHVPYMPLKGYYMKRLYPSPLLRSSCDLDVLFPPERTAEVKRILAELGFNLVSAGDNHMMHSRGNVTVEMHYFLGEVPACPDYYKNVFSKLVHVNGELYKFTDEDFYIFMIAHICKHFKSGGTGIRSVMDIYVYLTKKTELDIAYIDDELKKLKLSVFEEKMRRLAFCWFGGQTAEGLEKAENFILGSGVYGTTENATASGTAQMGKKGFFLRRTFPKATT